MKGKPDFPCLQIFKLKVLRASKAPSKEHTSGQSARFLEKTKPRSPPLKTSPPITKYKLKVISKYSFIMGKKICKQVFVQLTYLSLAMWAEVKHLQIKMLLKHFIGTLLKYIYIYMWSQSANVQKL